MGCCGTNSSKKSNEDKGKVNSQINGKSQNNIIDSSSNNLWVWAVVVVLIVALFFLLK